MGPGTQENVRSEKIGLKAKTKAKTMMQLKRRLWLEICSWISSLLRVLTRFGKVLG